MEKLRARAPDGARGQGAYVDGPRKSFAGGAGLLSTAPDYARFLEMIRRGGALDGVRILSPRTVALMTSNQVGTLHSPAGLGYGLGFETTDRFGANGLDPAGAFGWAGAYSSTYRVDPESHLVIVLHAGAGRADDHRPRAQVPDAGLSGAGAVVGQTGIRRCCSAARSR